MKKIIYGLMILQTLTFTACDTYLDKVPDRRAEVDTPAKVKDILLSAYPTVDPMMIYEHRTDNVMDNGKQYGSPTRTLEENYFWKDISDTEWDGPQALWNSCYLAIATANQALEEMSKMAPNEVKAQRGEALLCRAYAHFLLANTFCKPYDAATAATDLGIPYVEETEKIIGKTYQRGTVKDVYEKIARDIEEGFPLIDDNSYSVPLYHFNRKASAAFAARFYLYYWKPEKALEFANQAIDTDPSAVLRNFNYYTVLNASDEWRDRFISTDEPANFMLVALRSLYGRNYHSQRYGNSDQLTSLCTYRSAGPWGNLLRSFDLLFGASGYAVKFQPKYNEIFEITNQTAQTGQPHVVQMAFTTDETLLVRAEAHALLKQYAETARDLSIWYVSKQGTAASADEIVSYYKQKKEAETESLNKGELKPWLLLVKPLHPKGFTIDGEQQEMMIHAVLHARRIETIFSGLRWLDIRRYGLEVVHNVDENEPITLSVDDPRRVIQIPQAVVAAGIEANPK